MTVSIRTSTTAAYPDARDAFSPGETYPEYRLGSLSGRPNLVYGQVRELLAQLGLDRERFGTPEWNPLRGLVPDGGRVFVLCNFVYHRRAQESEARLHSKCTHGSVLRALVDYVLLAAGPGGRVTFGNAPLQSCVFERVLEETGAASVARFYADRRLPVQARDLRLFVATRDVLGRVVSTERRDDADGLEIDFGAESLLTALPRHNGAAPFRVADYDPRRIEAFHEGGRHRYILHRDVLAADVVISLPKLKTHEKVGITCGLKGFVGAVGHKDCLAHHRFGSTLRGGDEYPAGFRFLEPASRLHDWIYARHPGAALQGLAQVLDRTLRRITYRTGAVMAGAWHGNDTAWRMSMDLARILHFADAAGRLHDTRQRRHLCLVDGIVAGEGNGPLDPRPAPAGTLIFGDDVTAVDRVACRLMGFDPDAIALTREPLKPMRYKVTALEPGAAVPCVLDGRRCLDAELGPVLGRPFVPPAGWRAQENLLASRAPMGARG